MAVAGLFGLAVGSFCAAVVWRAPRGISLVSPGSACPHCGTPIPMWFKIPVAGWLALRGRARCCGQRTSVMYPLVEATTAVSWVLLALLVQQTAVQVAALPAAAAIVSGAAVLLTRP